MAKKQRIISTGSQFGGPDAWNEIGPFFNKWSEAIDQSNAGCFLKNVDCLTIIWRVAGKLNDFDGGEGCERFEYQKKGHMLGIDLVVPVSSWANVSKRNFSEYIYAQNRLCTEILIDWCIDNDEFFKKKQAVNEIEKILVFFENSLESVIV